jgi:hypothetical protein
MILATRTKVLGHTWIIYFLPSRQFKKNFGADCLGVTLTEERQIHLRAKSLKLETVVHELVHAYVTELCLDVTGLQAGQMEEAMCDLFARYGARLLKQSEEALAKYGRLKAKASS